ncbi:MAG: hypothetical protein ACE5GD_01115 [Candidatus Geothermarchaeales archaeon]
MSKEKHCIIVLELAGVAGVDIPHGYCDAAIEEKIFCNSGRHPDERERVGIRDHWMKRPKVCKLTYYFDGEKEALDFWYEHVEDAMGESADEAYAPFYGKIICDDEEILKWTAMGYEKSEIGMGTA